MSWRASAWAKEQRLGSPAAKSILLCLADYADPEKAECWPSQTQLAADAEVSERTAREWLLRLEEWGLICRARRSRANGARASDMIVLQLGVSVRDGAERCREIKACEADAGENLPAEIAGRTNRQPDAEPTGNEEQPTGNQCRAYKEEPSIEPPKGTSQPAPEGARESGNQILDREEAKRVDAAFWRVVKDWPGFAGMPKEPARKAWLKLSAEERVLAEARLPGWLALLRAQKKSHTPAPATYFGERLWQDVPEPVEVAKPVDFDAPAFGPHWAAVRLRAFLLETPDPSTWPAASAFMATLLAQDDAKGAAARLERQATYGWPGINRMHQNAENRRGIRVTIGSRAEALGRLMEAVPVGSPVYAAWRLEHERRGWPWIPDPGGMRVVYFPAGGPGALDAFEAAIRGDQHDAGGREAAE